MVKRWLYMIYFTKRISYFKWNQKHNVKPANSERCCNSAVHDHKWGHGEEPGLCHDWSAFLDTEWIWSISLYQVDKSHLPIHFPYPRRSARGGDRGTTTEPLPSDLPLIFLHVSPLRQLTSFVLGVWHRANVQVFRLRLRWISLKIYFYTPISVKKKH